MFRRRVPAPTGDALCAEAFDEVEGLPQACATLRAHFPSRTAQVAGRALSTADPHTSRASASSLREEGIGALGEVPALAAWVVLAGPTVRSDYDGYGVRDALHALRDLRREVRGRADVPQSPEVGEAARVVLDLLHGPVEAAVCAGITTWHLRARRGCVSFLEEASDLQRAIDALEPFIAHPADEPDDDLRYARGEAVQVHQRLSARLVARTRRADPGAPVPAVRAMDNTAARRLIALAEDDPDEGVRIRAFEALARLEPHPGMLDVALQGAAEDSPSVRRAAIALLERLARA